MVEALFTEAGILLKELDAIAFGQGPGSFLGTRIAAGVAQGLGFALTIPLIPISSLWALAERAAELCSATSVFPAWDARMGSLYWGHYQWVKGCLQSVTPDAILKPRDFILPKGSEDGIFVGNGWLVYKDELSAEITLAPNAEDWYPDAQYLLKEAVRRFQVGDTVEPADGAPIYLRDAL
jgi:tRNA threonylcarbamoyladenosine biosynthesis protein TsaB